MSVFLQRSGLLSQLKTLAASFAARRWRIWMDAPEEGSFLGLTIVEFRDEIGGPTASTSGTPLASSEYDGNHLVEYVFDGTTSTKWATVADAFPAWVEYDFGEGNDILIKEVAVTCRDTGSTNQAPNNIKIQAYVEAISDWIDFADADQTPWSAFEQRLIEAVQAPDELNAVMQNLYVITGPVVDGSSAVMQNLYVVLIGDI